MKPDELRELAAVLTGIADRKPWQIASANSGWLTPLSYAGPIKAIEEGNKIRLKPWELTGTVNGHTLPPGAEWHRQDWTEDMLPPPYRPLMLGEMTPPGDEILRPPHYKKWESLGGSPSDYLDSPCDHVTERCRTTRPIPFALTPEQIADGWVLWNGGECPVEPESRPMVMFRRRQTIQEVAIAATNLDWKHQTAADGGDIIAYRPDPYGHLRQALADGKTVQVRSHGEWHDEDFTSCKVEDFSLNFIRIKEPQWLPLGPSDVPPGTVLRGAGEIDSKGWCMITSCSETGIRLWRQSDCTQEETRWRDLMDYESQINRSIAAGKWDPAAWEPCRKQAP